MEKYLSVGVKIYKVGNGCERKFFDTRTVTSYTWPFLSTQCTLTAGVHTFNFDLILPGNLPESTHVDKYYNVEYKLTALAEKPTFSRNYIARRDVHLSRQRSHITTDYFDPITVHSRWEDKLSCQVSLPTKVYTYGDLIPIKIEAISYTPHLQIHYVSCTFKEYVTCRPVNGWFNGKNKSQGRLVEYTRRETSQQKMKMNEPWPAMIEMQVPESRTEIQCDANNDSVQVRHQLKLILSIKDKEGRLFEQSVLFPIIIAITDSIGLLPSYQDVWQTLPYSPFLILTPSTCSIIPPSYHSR